MGLLFSKEFTIFFLLCHVTSQSTKCYNVSQLFTPPLPRGIKLWQQWHQKRWSLTRDLVILVLFFGSLTFISYLTPHIFGSEDILAGPHNSKGQFKD